MIEGYSVKDWKSLPVAERAALFGERILKFGLENLTNPDDVDRLDRINNLTVDIYTGNYHLLKESLLKRRLMN